MHGSQAVGLSGLSGLIASLSRVDRGDGLSLPSVPAAECDLIEALEAKCGEPSPLVVKNNTRIHRADLEEQFRLILVLTFICIRVVS